MWRSPIFIRGAIREVEDGGSVQRVYLCESNTRRTVWSAMGTGISCQSSRVCLRVPGTVASIYDPNKLKNAI